jgi:hypothetical protein
VHAFIDPTVALSIDASSSGGGARLQMRTSGGGVRISAGRQMGDQKGTMDSKMP